MDQATIQIRNANISDMREIHNLVMALARYENGEDNVKTTIEDYERDFQLGMFRAIVAEAAGQTLGMALFYPTYSTWRGKMLYLEDLYVKEEFRRAGIGQLLFDRLIHIGKEEGFNLMKWQVLDWNEPAIKFYERNSARLVKTWWNGIILLSAPES